MNIIFDKIGSDPEFFIKNEKEFLPSYFFTEGTKENPLEIGNGFKILKDNLVFEGNIPPASNKIDWIKNMLFLKNEINLLVKKENAFIFEDDIATFSTEYIETMDGQLFGCSSYKDAWKLKEFNSPIFKDNDRTCGFHIHISYDLVDLERIYPSKEMMNAVLARALDFFLGIPSDHIFYCKKRRQGYGSLGSYRDTSYGIEYRPLGGHFTKDCYLSWIYDQVQKAINFLQNIENVNKLLSLPKPKKEYYDFLGINLEEQININ